MIKRIPVSKGHHGVDVSPKGDYAYITGIGSDVVTVVDVKRWEVHKRVSVGMGPHGVRFSPDGKMAFVAVARENNVVVVDTRKHEVVGKIPAPEFPFWIGVRGKP